VSSRTVHVTWVIGILIWVLICSVGWYVATRDDYTKLSAANACYSITVNSPVTVAECANVKQSDIRTYKAAIDRKAAISRVTAALGSAVALALWFLLGRPGLAVGQRR
jgi:hypothetical protein